MVAPNSWRAFCMAMDRVEQRLLRVTAALDAARIPYAVIGGNAVAVWIAKANPAATRTTKDVDLLVSRADIDRISDAMAALGFHRRDLRRMVLFLDPDEPDPRSGVHLVWAGQKVRPSYSHPAPLLDESIQDDAGFRLLELAALVRMKLTSLRDIDRVHIADLLSVRLIDQHIRSTLPADLAERLEAIEASRDADLDD